jgi:hypothetical protein
MTVIAVDTDYTDRDLASLEERLFALIESVFPEWTDRSRADFGNILVSLMAKVGDKLAYYQDNQAREAFPVSATQRKNVLALAKWLGFEASGAEAASTTETFTLGAVPAADVTFPAGTRVLTDSITNPVAFQLLAALTIPAGTAPPTASATVENSESESDSLVSDGTPNQEFTLGSTPYLDGSAALTYDGGAWTEVDNFLSSTATDRHFVVVVDQNDQAKLRFGNGVVGRVLVAGSFTVDYKTGGGVSGNVETGALRRIEGSFTDDAGNPVTVTVTNVVAIDNGADRQAIAVIQALAPESLRTLTRTVSREDFEINAKQVTGVTRALMMTSNEDPGIDENEGYLYIVPTGGGTPSAALKTAVHVMVTVTKPCMTGFLVSEIDPVYLTVNIVARVWLANGHTAATVRTAIQAALTAWFAMTNSDGTVNANVDFGFNMKNEDGDPANEIAWSTLFDVVRDVAGVRKVGYADTDFTLNDLHRDLSIATNQFPILGTVTLLNGATGAAL